MPLIISFFAVGVLYRNLDTFEYEVLFSVLALISAFTISDFGIGRITCIQIINNRNNYQIVNNVIVNGFIASCILAILLFVVSYYISLYFLQLTLLERLLFSFTIFFTTLYNGTKGVFDGFERFKSLVKYKIAQSSLIYMLPAIMSIFNISVTYMILSVFVVRLFTATILIVRCWQFLKYFDFSFYRPSLKVYLVLGRWSFISNGVSILLAYIDRFFVIKLIGGSGASGYLTVVDFTSKTTVLAGAYLQASFFKLVNNNKATSNSIYFLISLVFFSAVLVFYFVGDVFILLWLGERSELIFNLFLLLICSAWLNSLSQIPYYSLLSKNKQKTIGLIHLLELIFFIPISYYLISIMGVVGAAMSLVIRNLVDFMLLRHQELYYFKKTNNFVWREINDKR